MHLCEPWQFQCYYRSDVSVTLSPSWQLNGDEVVSIPLMAGWLAGLATQWRRDRFEMAMASVVVCDIVVVMVVASCLHRSGVIVASDSRLGIINTPHPSREHNGKTEKRSTNISSMGVQGKRIKLSVRIRKMATVMKL